MLLLPGLVVGMCTTLNAGLKANNIDTVQLMQSIEDVIIKAIISVEFPVNSACKMFVPHRLDAMLALFSYSFSGTTVLSSTGLIFWLTLT